LHHESFHDGYFALRSYEILCKQKMQMPCPLETALRALIDQFVRIGENGGNKVMSSMTRILPEPSRRIEGVLPPT
jgi:hypothetical protein